MDNLSFLGPTVSDPYNNLNIYGVYVEGSSNIRLTNLNFTDIKTPIKVGNGKESSKLYVSDVTTRGDVSVSLFLSDLDQSEFHRLDLAGAGSADWRGHNIYINRNVTNSLFEDVYLWNCNTTDRAYAIQIWPKDTDSLSL
jgi:hypothetical protein